MIKKIVTHIYILLLLLLTVQTASAQCTGGSLFPASAGTPGTTFGNIATNSFAGEYTTWNITKGYTYTWSTVTADGATCTYDSELTLLDNSGNLLGKYSDDVSGTQSRIVWTATYTGVVRVLLTAYGCVSNTTSTTVVAKRDAVSARLLVLLYTYRQQVQAMVLTLLRLVVWSLLLVCSVRIVQVSKRLNFWAALIFIIKHSLFLQGCFTMAVMKV